MEKRQTKVKKQLSSIVGFELSHTMTKEIFSLTQKDASELARNLLTYSVSEAFSRTFTDRIIGGLLVRNEYGKALSKYDLAFNKAIARKKEHLRWSEKLQPKKQVFFDGKWVELHSAIKTAKKDRKSFFEQVLDGETCVNEFLTRPKMTQDERLARLAKTNISKGRETFEKRMKEEGVWYADGAKYEGNKKKVAVQFVGTNEPFEVGPKTFNKRGLSRAELPFLKLTPNYIRDQAIDRALEVGEFYVLVLTDEKTKEKMIKVGITSKKHTNRWGCHDGKTKQASGMLDVDPVLLADMLLYQLVDVEFLFHLIAKNSESFEIKPYDGKIRLSGGQTEAYSFTPENLRKIKGLIGKIRSWSDEEREKRLVNGGKLNKSLEGLMTKIHAADC